MSVEIKQLDQTQIEIANMNSFGGKRGDIDAREYEVYCNRVLSWGLSERKTQQIIDKVHQYFSRSLSLDAQHVSVAVAGGSNYNAKRLDKSDKIIKTGYEFCEWFTEIERQATKKTHSRVGWLVKSIIFGVNGDYAVNKEWKELAGRSRKDFEILYDELTKRHGEFKKTSIPYKIYHNLIDVEQFTKTVLYEDADFCAYEEQGKIRIAFRLNPQRQLIVALKSRHFAWVAAYEVWQATATDELREWAKTIADKYEKWI